MEGETGIRLSQNRLSEVLHLEGYVYRRPKQDLGHRQDTLNDAKSGQKNARAGLVRLLYMDESGFSLNYPLSKCWMKEGQQDTIASTQPST